jgi:para-nitrobenzyl esterase
LFGGPSEDCLYLNVWTAANDSTERRPVMVYLFGGAFNGGNANDSLLDGSRFAKKGVVLVTLNHRVGIFGFLAHPELSAEFGKGSGCYGILDQIAALRWVKDNIAQFGGDPSNVTVFGQSSGGTSVSILTQSPIAKGLFQRAICQSGGAMAPFKTASDQPGGLIISLALAEKQGEGFLASLGVKDIKAARALSAKAVMKGKGGLPWPVADGHVLAADPHTVFQRGRFNDTPILVGYNSDDGGLFGGLGAKQSSREFEEFVRKDFARGADAILAAYPHTTKSEAQRSSRDMIREMLFGWPTWAWANQHVENGKGKVFLYYFDHPKAGGAGHGTEVAYVFGNLDGFLRPGSSRRNVALSDTIMSYWINFAKTGNPNGPELPDWPAFERQSKKAMILDETPEAGTLPDVNKLRAFDAYWTTVRANLNLE